MTHIIPACPSPLPNRLRTRLAAISLEWAAHPDRPEPSDETLQAWDRLLKGWCDRVDIPLLVRKGREARGTAIKHNSGRVIVPVDNSSAHWSFIRALRGECPSLEEVESAFERDQIPVAMVLKKEELTQATYRRTRKLSDNLNALGWKLSHIKPVAIKSRGSLATASLQVIHEHFLLFMNPANMFLVPKQWAGLGETEEMVSAIEDWKRAQERC